MSKLTPLQEKTLLLLARSPMKEQFYWTGGTALAVVYLGHRMSQDLDFFSDKRFLAEDARMFIQELKEHAALSLVEEKKVFDRFEFFLRDGEDLRLEFAHYDYPNIGDRKEWNGISVDSLDDIATNKTMALLDRNEPKDIVDLYFLLTKGGYEIETLLMFVSKKFGVRADKGLMLSEAMRGIDSIDHLQPFLIGTEKERSQTIKNIKSYFQDLSKQFLTRALS